jgi:regulator of replication initiation timing
MEVDLCSHLKFNGEKFYWDSTITDLKVFVSCDLKLTGRWLSPGGEVKTFTSDTLVLKWHGKTNKWITLSGSSTEVSELSQTLQSLCKEAEENQADIAEIHQTPPTNNGKEKPSVDLAAPTENQTEYSVRSNNDDKSYEDNFASIENQLKTLESKFLDKMLSIANDLNYLKKYCFNNEVEGMNILRQENASLKVENEALKDSLYTAKFPLSDLNTKVKDLEHEKASLTTTLKILYTDFHQAHEARFKQQDPPIVVDNNNHTKDESPSSISERYVGNCLSHTADETTLFPMTSLITKSAQQ